MRKIHFVMILFLSAYALASDDNINVLGYYAVTNSLDGQPMIDMVNVLRFYPVFAMRDSTDVVHVTVYYGGNIYERDADRMDGGKYWQVLMPIFRLGEAIQRVEVDVHFALDEFIVSKYGLRYISGKLEEWNEEDERLLSEREKYDRQLQFRGEQEFDRKKKENFGKGILESNRVFAVTGIMPPQADELRNAYQSSQTTYLSVRGALFATRATPPDTSLIDSIVHVRSELLNHYQQSYQTFVHDQDSIRSARDRVLADFDVRIAMRKKAQDSIYAVLDSARNAIVKAIQTGLTDTMYSGPSVRESDIVIDPDLRGARILYRNYKAALRHLVALDPAERLGIFRVRYVPFPITALSNDHRTSLRGPFGNDFTVFEVGLTFGDAIVSGDDFLAPQFAWNRLGIAFAITEKLFSDSAQVIGLALTYDFNSYGSIGIGGNFARHEANPYFSFGINKKAFEAVLGGLAGLFK